MASSSCIRLSATSEQTGLGGSTAATPLSGRLADCCSLSRTHAQGLRGFASRQTKSLLLPPWTKTLRAQRRLRVARPAQSRSFVRVVLW